ncbi:hypothetical protein EDC01DRAFT_630756 [Geopyxis carbonaria]|nr:hypothetical protein EDC01DRAFT_630756 [Geopyxis carbonaria]
MDPETFAEISQMITVAENRAHHQETHDQSTPSSHVATPGVFLQGTENAMRQLLNLFAAEAARAEAKIRDLTQRIETIEARIGDAVKMKSIHVISLQEGPMLPMATLTIGAAQAHMRDLRKELVAKKNGILDLEQLSIRVVKLCSMVRAEQ